MFSRWRTVRSRTFPARAASNALTGPFWSMVANRYPRGTPMKWTTYALASIALLAQSPARATATVCNNFQAPIGVAIAYDENGSVPSEGWWKVSPGGCPDVVFSGLDFYYTAESDSY